MFTRKEILNKRNFNFQQVQAIEAIAPDKSEAILIFDFTVAQLNRQKQIMIAPSKSLIIPSIFIRVTEPFNGVDTFLNVGTRTKPTGIGNLNVNAPVLKLLDLVSLSAVSEEITSPTPIIISITEKSGPSTTGKGTGIIRIIDLNTVTRV